MFGTIPNITQAYQNDPRTKIAQQLLQAGSSTAPVAGGGWAVTDGLARAAQAITGAFMSKAQEKKFAEREQEYTKEMAAAAALTAPQNSTTGQSIVATPEQEAMTAALQAKFPHAGSNAPAPMMEPSGAMPGQIPLGEGQWGEMGKLFMQPQTPVQPPQNPAVQAASALTGPPPQPPQIPSQPQQGVATPPTLNPAMSGVASPQQSPRPAPPQLSQGVAGLAVPNVAKQPKDGRYYFNNGIVPIEGGTDRKGRFLLPLHPAV